MVLSGLTNANPYLTPFQAPMHHLQANWPGGMSGFVEELEANPPEIIAFRGTRRFTDPTAVTAEWSDWIDDNYLERGKAPGWIWLVHRSVAERIWPDGKG